jgi:hypothetical protein
MRLALSVAFVLLACLAVPLRAQDVFQEGTTMTFELQNGDKLTGILEHADQSKLVIIHPVLGRIELKRADVKIPPPKPGTEAVAPWTGTFDVSLSGSEGNTDNSTFRANLDLKHDVADSVDTFTLWFRRAQTSDVSTEEKTFGMYRHEWKLKDSKWRPFWQASYEHDQFASYDIRGAVAGGAAYQISDGPVHKTAARFGLGVNRKWGVTDTNVEWLTYEALVGFDWFWKTSETGDFAFTTDVYPGIDPSGTYRAITRLSYNEKVAPDSPWYWRTGVDFFYDTEPGEGKKPQDYNYYFGVGRAF